MSPTTLELSVTSLKVIFATFAQLFNAVRTAFISDEEGGE
jgi:hypothetical protein